MFKFLPTVSSVQSILINNSVDLGGAPIVFQGSSCPIIKHKQITIRCLLSNEIIQVLIQQFVTSMCTKLTFGRHMKIINNRFNPELPLAIMSFILQNKYWRAYFHNSTLWKNAVIWLVHYQKSCISNNFETAGYLSLSTLCCGIFRCLTLHRDASNKICKTLSVVHFM